MTPPDLMRSTIGPACALGAKASASVNVIAAHTRGAVATIFTHLGGAPNFPQGVRKGKLASRTRAGRMRFASLPPPRGWFVCT